MDLDQARRFDSDDIPNFCTEKGPYCAIPIRKFQNPQLSKCQPRDRNDSAKYGDKISTGILSLPDYTKQVTNAELGANVLGVGSPVFHVPKNTCIRKKTTTKKNTTKQTNP